MFNNLIPDNLRGQLSDTLDNAGEELRSNERLQWIIAGGLFILYLTFFFYSANLSGAARQSAISNANRLSQLVTQASETTWPQRADEAEEIAGLLKDQFWPGNTTGLAEAGFERWIRQGFEQYGSEVRQVLLTRGPADDDTTVFMSDQLSDVLKIRAKVIGPLEEAALIQFLHDAGTYQHWVIVEQLIIRDGRNPRFEMDLATFSRTGDTE